MPEVATLAPADLARYEATLSRSHERRVTLELLTLGSASAGMLDVAVVGGSVAVTMGSETEVSRVLTVQAADPRRQLDFAPESPGAGVYFTRQLRVYDERYVPGLGWCRAVPFTGPVWSYRRTGPDVEIVAHSVDRLAMGAIWSSLEPPKGRRKTSVIRDDLLIGAAGFSAAEVSIPDLPSTLPNRNPVDRFESPWAVAWRLAGSLNRQLMPTGGGRVVLREPPSTLAYTWRGGDGGSVLSDPAVERALEGWRTDVVVLGKRPRGNRARPSATASVAADHPLSAKSLGRNGRPRHLAEVVEDDAQTTTADCQRAADRALAERIRTLVLATFDSAPVPHLSPGDLCALELPEGAVQFRLREFTIPLGPETASIGKVQRSRL